MSSKLELKIDKVLQQQAEILRLLGADQRLDLVDIPCRYSARRDQANARAAELRDRRQRRMEANGDG